MSIEDNEFSRDKIPKNTLTENFKKSASLLKTPSGKLQQNRLCREQNIKT